MAGNEKESKPDKNKKIANKDTGIQRKSGETGRYAKGRESLNRNKNDKQKRGKEKSINEMGGKGVNANDPKKVGSRKDGGKRATDPDELTRNRRRKRRTGDRVNQEKKQQDKREEEARQQKVEDLRNRRRAVQTYMNVAKTSTNPFNEINWADKNLKARDRRKLREELQNRGFSDKEIYDSEKTDIHKRIKDNQKKNRSMTAGFVADGVGLASTGGLSALLSIPSIAIKAFKIRKNKEETKNLKKSMKWRRLLLLLPTILITLGLMLAVGIVVAVGSQFVGTMLSHPEAIKELNKAGVLGNALYMGNVTEDVVVDGEVIVKGNPSAEPGCFIYNGVWYCGGCLATGEVQASENNTATEGKGEVTGDLAEPMKSPYTITSNFGGRWGSTHKGIDLVGLGKDLSVYASDGGEVTVAKGSCAPGSGHYPNNDAECGGWGNYVQITHKGQPYEKTQYGHLDEVTVKEGDKVEKGQKIGVMGHTGSSTAPHLHFEVWTGDNADTRDDPRNYIKTFPAEGQSK